MPQEAIPTVALLCDCKEALLQGGLMSLSADSAVWSKPNPLHPACDPQSPFLALTESRSDQLHSPTAELPNSQKL